MQENDVITKLIDEAVTGVTIRDTLSGDAALPLQGEAEAMYFKAIRSFFETSVSHLIMDYNQDIAIR